MNKLLPEQGVLGDELGVASGKVSCCGERNRIVGGSREVEESLFESRDEVAEQLDE